MNFSVEKGLAEDIKADVLIAPVFEGVKTFSGTLAVCDKRMNGFIKEELAEAEFNGEAGSAFIVHTHGQLGVKRIILVGVGKKNDLTPEALRRMAATAVLEARTVRAKTAVCSFEGILPAKIDETVAAQAVAEGVLLSDYTFLEYKGEEKEKLEKKRMKTWLFVTSDARTAKKIEKGVVEGQMFADATIFTRDLVNEPAITMTPKHMASMAEQLNSLPGVKVTVYGHSEIKKMKMGALLGVNAGSDEPPFFVHMKYTPKKKNVKKIAICGKGITFDSGGLSLKPTHYMDTMKSDMAGAAAVIGVFSRIADLAPSVEVHGVIALTENMISGKATRPGDVLTAYNGKTIEVSNTDAEGRLILADALSWVEKNLKPDYIVDIATLTGAQIIALGQEYAAMMGSDEKLIEAYRTAAAETGELVWQLPLVMEYRPLLNSNIADIANITKNNWAGSITAAVFLKEFVKDTPWLHLDIAGPAWVERRMVPYIPEGASGYTVRTVMQLLRNLK